MTTNKWYTCFDIIWWRWCVEHIKTYDTEGFACISYDSAFFAVEKLNDNLDIQAREYRKKHPQDDNFFAFYTSYGDAKSRLSVILGDGRYLVDAKAVSTGWMSGDEH